MALDSGLAGWGEDGSTSLAAGGTSFRRQPTAPASHLSVSDLQMIVFLFNSKCKQLCVSNFNLPIYFIQSPRDGIPLELSSILQSLGGVASLIHHGVSYTLV